MSKSFLRIRPVSGYSSKNRKSAFFKLDDTKVECIAPETSQAFKNLSKSNMKDMKNRVFEFDKVLDETADQEQLYNDCVQPLITEFFDGQNVLLFAYGTTSSGKTYTMRGDAKNPGVVPRTINDIFRSIQDKLMPHPDFKKTKFNECEPLNKLDFKRDADIKSNILNSIDDRSVHYLNNLRFRPEGFKSFLKDNENIRHIVWVSFLELYNENLVDLLVNTQSNSFVHPSTSNLNNDRPVQLKVMRDSEGNFHVSGLTQVYVNSFEEAMKIYLFGIDKLKKHISSTAMNLTSSRSHSLFTISVITLKMKGSNDFKPVHVNNFSFCDLAGQERNKKAKTIGIHCKEAAMINKSLFSLRRCIQVIKERKLSSSQLIIPFTESVLTKTFQPYLSGNGLTFMIININPESEHFDETINSLEFSSTAVQVVPVLRTDSTNSLRGKIERLTQHWLQTSNRWSKLQDANKNQSSYQFLIDAASRILSDKKKSSTDQCPIVDSANLLNDFENSITQKAYEFEKSFVEFEKTCFEFSYDLYNEPYVKDLSRNLDRWEQQIEDINRNGEQNGETNLESIYNSIAEIYQLHEKEKKKITERMNSLMDKRMQMLNEQHDMQVDEYEKNIEDLNIKLMSKENEVERMKGNEIERETQLNTQLARDLEDKNKILESKELELQQLKESYSLREQKYMESFNSKEKEYKEQISKSSRQIEDLERALRLKELEFNENLLTRELELNDHLLAMELRYDVGNVLENMIREVDYMHRLEQENQHTEEDHSIDASTTKHTENANRLQHDYSIGQFSLIDFNKSLLNLKRSSLKRPIDFNQHQNSPSLFTTNIMPITNEQPASPRKLENRSILEFESHLNSTSRRPKLPSADQLLDSVVVKNYEKEIEELRNQRKENGDEIKQLKMLLEMKDQEIKKFTADILKLKKEIYKNTKVKDETVTKMNSSHVPNLYSSVLNHSKFISDKTPFKPMSTYLASARKKRPIDESEQQDADDRYLDYVKNNEKSPTTENRTKKKRTEKKSKIKEELPFAEVIEERAKNLEMEDDLLFVFEEATVKKKTRGARTKKEITTSVRKKIPLEKCRESFVSENEEEPKKKRSLRTCRKKITYK